MASAAAVAKMREREAHRINTSLSALGAVIKALSSRTPTAATRTGTAPTPQFVPYRNSVLTWLLKESLGTLTDAIATEFTMIVKKTPRLVIRASL